MLHRRLAAYRGDLFVKRFFEALPVNFSATTVGVRLANHPSRVEAEIIRSDYLKLIPEHRSYFAANDV